MIEVILGADAPHSPKIIQQMYRQRCEVYIRQRKWADLSADDGLEHDEFDTGKCVYLVAINEDEEVLGGLRLLPTTAPHLFDKYFKDLSSTFSLPHGEDVYELTRFYVAPSCRSPRLQHWLPAARIWLCGFNAMRGTGWSLVLKTRPAIPLVRRVERRELSDILIDTPMALPSL